MDSWWAVVAGSGRKTEDRSTGSPLREGRCFCTDAVGGGSTHLGMGQESDLVLGPFLRRDHPFSPLTSGSYRLVVVTVGAVENLEDADP